MTIDHGYGDPSIGTEHGKAVAGVAQSGGGYGASYYGYGHPIAIATWHIEGGSAQHDLGGEKIFINAGNPGVVPAGPFTVKIGGVQCYSGEQGSGFDISPDATLLRFGVVTPNLFGQLGAVDVVITHGGGTVTLPGIYNIVRHPGRIMTTYQALLHPRETILMRTFRPRD